MSALENGFCHWSRERELTVRLSHEGYQRLAVLSGQLPKHWLDLVRAVMAQSSCAGLGCWRDHELAGLVLVLAGQDGRFDRVGAQRLTRFVEHQHAARGKFARPCDGEFVDLGIWD